MRVSHVQCVRLDRPAYLGGSSALKLPLLCPPTNPIPGEEMSLGIRLPLLHVLQEKVSRVVLAVVGGCFKRLVGGCLLLPDYVRSDTSLSTEQPLLTGDRRCLPFAILHVRSPATPFNAILLPASHIFTGFAHFRKGS